MKNLKPTLLTLLLCATTFSAVVAQEKYEYIQLSEVQAQSGKIYIAASTSSDYKEDVISAKSFDSRELLKRVEEYSGNGWEVYNTAFSTYYMQQNSLTYFLRKKKS